MTTTCITIHTRVTDYLPIWGVKSFVRVRVVDDSILNLQNSKKHMLTCVINI